MTNLELILKRFFAKYRAEHPDIQQIDLSVASADRDLPRKNARIVLTDNHTTPWDFNLPSATGSGAVISIYNQSDASVDVNPVGTQTINGANTARSIVTMETMAFVDYTSGKWVAILGGASSQSSEPLAIYIPMVGSLDASSAVVVWATNKDASTIVKYRRSVDSVWTEAYDSGASYTSYHEYTITGLAVNTQYDVYIQSDTLTETANETLLEALITIGTTKIVNIKLYALPSASTLSIVSLGVTISGEITDLTAEADDTATNTGETTGVTAATLTIVSQSVTVSITDDVSTS